MDVDESQVRVKRYRRPVELLLYAIGLPDDPVHEPFLKIWRYAGLGRIQLYKRTSCVPEYAADENEKITFQATNYYSQYSKDCLIDFIPLIGYCDENEPSLLIHLLDVGQLLSTERCESVKLQPLSAIGAIHHSNPYKICDECIICKKLFIHNVMGLRDHYVNEHSIIGRPKCGYCSDVFENCFDFRQHCWIEHDTDELLYECWMCNEKMDDFTNMLVHIKSFCRIEKFIPYLCRFCGNTNVSRHKLMTHIRRNHGSFIQDSINRYVPHVEPPKVNACSDCERKYNTALLPTLIGCTNEVERLSRLTNADIAYVMDRMDCGRTNSSLTECLPNCLNNGNYRASMTPLPDLATFKRISKPNIDQKCLYCPLTFDSIELLGSHFTSKHHEYGWSFSINADIPDHNFPQKDRNLICYICMQLKDNWHSFYGSSTIAQHMHKHLPDNMRRVYCVYCPYSVKTMESLKDHVRQKHSLIPLYVTCPKCDFRTDVRTRFRHHWQKFHFKTYGSYNRFYRHKFDEPPNPANNNNNNKIKNNNNHDDDDDDDDDDYYYDDDDDDGDDNDDNDNDLRINFDNSNYRCPYCPNEQAFQQRMRVHIMHAHPSKIVHHKCPNCDRAYLHRRSVKAHLPKCQQIKGNEFACDICDILLWDGEALRKHELKMHCDEFCF